MNICQGQLSDSGYFIFDPPRFISVPPELFILIREKFHFLMCHLYTFPPAPFVWQRATCLQCFSKNETNTEHMLSLCPPPLRGAEPRCAEPEREVHTDRFCPFLIPFMSTEYVNTVPTQKVLTGSIQKHSVTAKNAFIKMREAPPYPTRHIHHPFHYCSAHSKATRATRPYQATQGALGMHTCL